MVLWWQASACRKNQMIPWNLRACTIFIINTSLHQCCLNSAWAGTSNNVFVYKMLPQKIAFRARRVLIWKATVLTFCFFKVEKKPSRKKWKWSISLFHSRTHLIVFLSRTFLPTHTPACTPTRTHAHAPTHTHSFVLISLNLRGNQLFVKIWLKLLKVFIAADLLELFIENENKSSKKRQIQISSRARTNLSFVDSSHSPRFFWKFAQEGQKQVQHGQSA